MMVRGERGNDSFHFLTRQRFIRGCNSLVTTVLLCIAKERPPCLTFGLIFVLIAKGEKSLGIAFTRIFSRVIVVFLIDLHRSIEPSPNIKSVLPPEVVVNSRETEGFEFFAHSRKQEGKTIEKPHARTQKPDLWKRSSSDVWLSKSGDGLI